MKPEEILMNKKIRILVVGLGGMGSTHATAYTKLNEYEIIGFVDAMQAERAQNLAKSLKISIPVFTNYYEAMKQLEPDAVSINTYPDTHAEYSIYAMKHGCHVFVEKPIARTVDEAETVVNIAHDTKRKLVVGYILRQHPAWQQFIQLARQLGKPLIMRMNLNQQSFGHEWSVHKTFIKNMPPLVDCGVHYLDIMCQITQSQPKFVQAIAARVTDEIDPDLHNYGQLQVGFEDGSVGWYEVGWGPMISKTAYFIKDVIGPKGSVSMDKSQSNADPSDVSKHTEVNTIIIHSSETDNQGKPLHEDRLVHIEDEPDHNELCKREQEYLLRAIKEDLDLSDHWDDAVNSLKIGLAAVESYKKGMTIHFS